MQIETKILSFIKGIITADYYVYGIGFTWVFIIAGLHLFNPLDRINISNKEASICLAMAFPAFYLLVYLPVKMRLRMLELKMKFLEERIRKPTP